MRFFVPLIILVAVIGGGYWYLNKDKAPTEEPSVEAEAPAPETSDMDTDDTAPMTMDEATAGPSNVALWKTGDEDTTVYLMGTIHILKPGLEWETDAFRAAWAESPVVYFEANVGSQEEMQAAAPVVMGEGFYNDGRTLADLYTEEEIAQIDEAISEYGLSVKSLANMRPWFASIQLTQLALTKAGGVPMAGIEMLLSAQAKQQGKTERFFETPADQIRMIGGIPDEVWATALLEGLEDLTNVEGFYAQLVGFWYRGDADGLAAFMAEGWEETPEMVSTLLWERNEKWAVTLDTLIEEEPGTFFVAVGAGHLAGKNSVQDYLAGHGHETVRINP